MQRTAISASKTISGLAAAAVATAAFAASALGSAPAAHATCASFWGIGNGNGCTSSFGNVAIAIGTGATATAEGFLTTAVAAGTNTIARVFSGSSLSSATAFGNDGVSESFGALQTAIAMGNHTAAFAGTDGNGAFPQFPNSFLGLAVNVSSGAAINEVVTAGNANVAINLGGGGTTAAEALGTLNTAIVLGGNTVEAVAANFNDQNNLPAAFANFAFTVFGSHAVTNAGGGPFAIAGSIGQTNQTVAKQGPGFNINGVKVGGAAAPSKATTAATTVKAAGLSSKKRTTGSAAAVKHVSKK
jgi:hypothetical protein